MTNYEFIYLLSARLLTGISALFCLYFGYKLILKNINLPSDTSIKYKDFVIISRSVGFLFSFLGVIIICFQLKVNPPEANHTLENRLLISFDSLNVNNKSLNVKIDSLSNTLSLASNTLSFLKANNKKFLILWENKENSNYKGAENNNSNNVKSDVELKIESIKLSMMNSFDKNIVNSYSVKQDLIYVLYYIDSLKNLYNNKIKNSSFILKEKDSLLIK